jgi:N-acetyl-alpha-D-glucosaminyl L-malate synthase BshA
MKKLSIGIVCYPSVGGSGVVATQLGNALAERGHKVHFISYDPPFKWSAKQKNTFFHQVQINEYVLFKYPDYTLPLAVKIVEVSKKYKLDILHVHYAVPHATAALLAKDIANAQRIHFPHVVTTLHGTDITLLAKDANVMPVIKYSIESSCGVTAVSENLKRQTTSVLKTKKDISVIHNFYSPKKPTKSRDTVRKNLGVKESDFLAIHLSNMRPVKRIPDLLKIMALVKKWPNIKLLLLAGGDVEQYLPLMKKLGVEKNIIIRKNILDIENYISAADVGIYTSEDESFGMGILETMLYGKPVLSTKVGGIPEVMQHGKTGFLFTVGDTRNFAKKLTELSTDQNLVTKLGAQAYARATNDFSADKKVSEYLAYYQNIIKSGK